MLKQGFTSTGIAVVLSFFLACSHSRSENRQMLDKHEISPAEGLNVTENSDWNVHDEVDQEFVTSCQLKVFHKTPGAVGNPCATTEDFATSILSEKQLEVFRAYKDISARQLAH